MASINPVFFLLSGTITGIADFENENNVALANVLEKVIPVIPYVGVALTLLGIVVAVFSVRNKNNRRWGIRVAIIFSILSFLFYVALSVVHDMYCLGLDSGIRYSDTKEFYSVVYESAIERMIDNDLHFLLFTDEWYLDAFRSLQNLYLRTAFYYALVSFQVGFVLFIVAKRDRSLKRWSLLGLCFIIPLALFIGYQYIL